MKTDFTLYYLVNYTLSPSLFLPPPLPPSLPPSPSLDQVIGTLLTFGGFILIFLVSTQPSFPHGVIGTILTAIIAQQFLTGIL